MSQMQKALATPCKCSLTIDESEACQPKINQGYCITGAPSDDIVQLTCDMKKCETTTAPLHLACSGTYPNCGTYTIPQQSRCSLDTSDTPFRGSCVGTTSPAETHDCQAVDPTPGKAGFVLVDNCSSGTDDYGICQGNCYKERLDPGDGTGQGNCVSTSPPTIQQGSCDPET
jgi:hypothetical protein